MSWPICLQWRIHKEVAEVHFEAKITDMESQKDIMDFIPTDQQFSKCSSAHQTLLG